MTSKKKDHQIKLSGLDELMQEAEANIEKMEAAAGVKEKEELGDPENWDLENMDLDAIEVLSAPSGPPSATHDDSDAEPNIEVPSLKEKAKEEAKEKRRSER